jgi:hypothetical protein
VENGDKVKAGDPLFEVISWWAYLIFFQP